MTSENVGFMFCNVSLPEWSIELANDRGHGQGYFGQCTGEPKEAEIIYIYIGCNL